MNFIFCVGGAGWMAGGKRHETQDPVVDGGCG